MTASNLYTLVMILGALGSLVFLIDYLRTAIIRFPWTQHIIALNVGIFLALGVSAMARLSIYEFFWPRFIAISFVVVIVWLQVPLLHYVRRKQRESTDRYPELSDEKPSRKTLRSLIRKPRD